MVNIRSHGLNTLPDLNRIWTGYEPDLNRIWTGYEPDMNRIWTGYEPDLNRIWTGYEPDMNRIWTGYEPDMNRIWSGYITHYTRYEVMNLASENNFVKNFKLTNYRDRSWKLRNEGFYVKRYFQPHSTLFSPYSTHISPIKSISAQFHPRSCTTPASISSVEWLLFIKTSSI